MLVIDEDVDDQLEPFGIEVDPHPEYVDDEDLRSAVDHFGQHPWRTTTATTASACRPSCC
jgi:hypothetical protein